MTEEGCVTITDRLLDRWERAARQRPQMGSPLVLALIAELRRERAAHAHRGARLGVLLEFLTGEPEHDGCYRLDVAAIADHGATVPAIFEMLAEMQAAGALDVGDDGTDGWVALTEQIDGREYILARGGPAASPAASARKAALLRTIAGAADD